VEIIEDGAFVGTGIESLILPSSVKYIGEQAFGWCYELRTVKIEPTNGAVVADWSFVACHNLEKIEVGYGILKLYGLIDGATTKVDYVIIPDSVVVFGGGIVQDGYNQTKVYLQHKDKSGIIEEECVLGWEASMGDLLYWYSEISPTMPGNYWHYAQDGVTPIEW